MKRSSLVILNGMAYAQLACVNDSIYALCVHKR